MTDDKREGGAWIGQHPDPNTEDVRRELDEGAERVVASVGLLMEQAKERGIDAAEYTVDIGTSSKGYTTQSQGHCTIVVDRSRRRLVGAFLAGLAASETIHECVLAIRADVSLKILADTIHAFPTVARVLGTAFVDADRDLG